MEFLVKSNFFRCDGPIADTGESGLGVELAASALSAASLSCSVKFSERCAPFSNWAALRRMPFGSPFWSFTTSPPGGFGVSRVMPLIFKRLRICGPDVASVECYRVIGCHVQIAPWSACAFLEAAAAMCGAQRSSRLSEWSWPSRGCSPESR